MDIWNILLKPRKTTLQIETDINIPIKANNKTQNIPPEEEKRQQFYKYESQSETETKKTKTKNHLHITIQYSYRFTHSFYKKQKKEKQTPKIQQCINTHPCVTAKLNQTK